MFLVHWTNADGVYTAPTCPPEAERQTETLHFVVAPALYYTSEHDISPEKMDLGFPKSPPTCSEYLWSAEGVNMDTSEFTIL